MIANAAFVWLTGSHVEVKLAELRKAGEPLRIADLVRPPIPPESNADTFLGRAADDVNAIQKELIAVYPRVGYPTGELAPAEVDGLEKMFAAYPRLMPNLEQAAACPDSDPQIDATQPPSLFSQAVIDHTARCRTLGRVLRARSSWLLAKGRPEDAVATQILMLRIARHYRRQPLLISYLMTAAVEQAAIDAINRVLQAAPVAPATRQAIDGELAQHETIEGYRWALRSERAFSLSTVADIPLAGLWITRGFTNNLVLGILDLYERHLASASRPYPEVAAAAGRPRPTSGGVMNPYFALVTLLEPSLTASRPPVERIRAMSRSLRVLSAIQARTPKDDRSATVPDLASLGLPAEITVDPFNGEPLKVKKDPRGWVVYSVGADLTDNGGLFEKAVNIGVGPTPPEPSAKKPPETSATKPPEPPATKQP